MATRAEHDDRRRRDGNRPGRRTTRIAIMVASLLALGQPAQALVPMSAGSPCDGGDLVRLLVGTLDLCSHGPDDHLARDGGTAAAEQSGATGASLPSLPPSCDGDGGDGSRVVVMAIDVDGRTGAAGTDVRRWAGQVEWTIQASAERSGGQRRLRWVTEANPAGGCRIQVQRVALSSSQVATFPDMIEALEALGHDRADRKYLAFVDVDVEICGIATVTRDDAPTNNSADRRVGYARVDRDCWASGDEGVYSVAAHELTHTLGGVQASAPNGTAGGHCTDEWDLMCYDDGAGATRLVCVDDDSTTNGANDDNHALLDCNGDDYFTAGTPSGWLASHWNVANSVFLTDRAGTGPGYPGGPDGPPARTVVLSPILGRQGPVVPEGYGWEACDLPIRVVIADGEPTVRQTTGLLGLGGSQETTPSSSPLRTSINQAASWVNGAVGRTVVNVDPDGIASDDAWTQSAPDGTIVVVQDAATASPSIRSLPTHVRLGVREGRITSARLSVDTGSSGGRFDAWVAQGLAQALGIGRGGEGDDLMASWPVASPNRGLAGSLLEFLYEPDACSQDRRIRDTASGDRTQRRLAGARGRLDLAVGQTAPVDVAVATAQWLRSERGRSWADLAVVCRDDVHADCLAGSALAGSSGPVLFVPGGRDGRLPSNVREELLASLASRGTVYVLGGTGAVSTEVERAIADALPSTATVRRLSGASRFETATAIAGEVLRRQGASSPGPTAVLLARADDPVDAVTAGAYAAAHEIPVLLTRPGDLPRATSTWLAAHGASIVAIGGRAAVSDSTLAAAGTVAGTTAVRVSGPDRFQTALAVSRDARLWGRTVIDGAGAFIVVNGRDPRTWAFALAAAPVAAHLAAPVVFAERDGLPVSVAEGLRRLPLGDAAPQVLSVTVGQGNFLTSSVVEQFHATIVPGFDGNVER